MDLAGVNRSADDKAFDYNIRLAQQLTKALDSAGSRPIIVYANSIQSGSDTRFGETKQAAADHLLAWGRRTSESVADVRLPNRFGEHGRPHYNSFSAPFSDHAAPVRHPTLT